MWIAQTPACYDAQSTVACCAGEEMGLWVVCSTHFRLEDYVPILSEQCLVPEVGLLIQIKKGITGNLT